MQRTVRIAIVVLTCGASLLACSDNQLLPTDAPDFLKGGVPAPQARINRLIKQVFSEKPARQAAKELFSEVKDNLSEGDVETAQALTFQLIDMARSATGSLQPKAELIDELLGFAGIGGAAGIVGSAGGFLVSEDQQAAVSFPPDALLGDEIISFYPKAQPCFPTSEIPANEQFDYCYTYEPSMTFETDVRVELCLYLPPSPEYDAAQLYSRSDGSPPVALQSVQHEHVNCEVPTASAGLSSFERIVTAGLNAVAGLLLPEPLNAGASLLPKGLGGLKGSFSDFGWALPQDRPDLTVQSIAISTAYQDAPFTVTVTVGNVGLGDAGPFAIGIQLKQDSDVLVLEDQVAGLAQGASIASAFTIPACSLASFGFYDLQATADVDSEVDEADEDNNSLKNVFFQVHEGSCP